MSVSFHGPATPEALTQRSSKPEAGSSCLHGGAGSPHRLGLRWLLPTLADPSPPGAQRGPRWPRSARAARSCTCPASSLAGPHVERRWDSAGAAGSSCLLSSAKAIGLLAGAAAPLRGQPVRCPMSAGTRQDMDRYRILPCPRSATVLRGRQRRLPQPSGARASAARVEARRPRSPQRTPPQTPAARPHGAEDRKASGLPWREAGTGIGLHEGGPRARKAQRSCTGIRPKLPARASNSRRGSAWAEYSLG